MSTALADSDWVSLWTSDPRPSTSTAQQVPFSRDADGLHVDATLTEAFAFWRLLPPEWTVTRLDTALTYAVGARVFDVSGTGHVYVALEAAAPGNNLADDRWEQVTLPTCLRRAVLHYARYLWLQSKDLPNNASTKLKLAQEALDTELFRSLGPDVTNLPWLQINLQR